MFGCAAAGSGTQRDIEVRHPQRHHVVHGVGEARRSRSVEQAERLARIVHGNDHTGGGKRRAVGEPHGVYLIIVFDSGGGDTGADLASVPADLHGQPAHERRPAAVDVADTACRRRPQLHRRSAGVE
ncbi:MAG: hypothetical protein WKF58_02315 [Ilumatobacteraceae bacterium]